HARLASIPADRIVNCWPLDRLLAWISDPSAFPSALNNRNSSVRLVYDGFSSSVVVPSHIASDSCPPDLWCAACPDEQPSPRERKAGRHASRFFRRHGTRHHHQCSSLPSVSECRDSCAAIFRANSRPPLVCSLRGLRPCLDSRQGAAHAEPIRILTSREVHRRGTRPQKKHRVTMEP